MVTRNPYSLFKKAICYKISFTPPQRGETDERCLPVKVCDTKDVNDFEIKAGPSCKHLNYEETTLSSQAFSLGKGEAQLGCHPGGEGQSWECNGIPHVWTTAEEGCKGQ